jgi:general secretion pathway protein H
VIHIRHIARFEHGVTLIEIMVALVLVGLIVVGAVTGLQSITKSDLRGSASRMAGAIRYVFDRASTTGRTHRLVFDFKEGSYWAEVTDDKVFLNSGKETEETRRKLAELVAKEAEEEREEAGKNEFQQAAIPARYLPKPYKPKRAEFSAFKETSIRKVTLPGKVILADYYVPRLESPLTEGQAYLYFFPLGMTEPALIHLSDAKRETFYSLVVHPLTGRVKVVNRYVEADVRETVDDEGKVVVP